MLLALALAASLSDCVPARWFSDEPKSLELLNGSPVSCLLVEKGNWTQPLIDAGHRRGIKMLAVIDTPSAPIPADADALVFEGDPPVTFETHGKPLLTFGTREQLRPAYGIAATAQAIWPGIRVDDKVLATPTTAPWIDTNLGFLRYISSQMHETIWLANRPPPDKTIFPHPYQKALADAALAGAQWVISPTADFAKQLLAGDKATRQDWDDLMALAKFIESLPRVHSLDIYSHLGVSVNRETGAYVSGGVLDMIGAQHIPFQVVKSGAGMEQFFDFADNAIVKFPPASLGRLTMRPGDADQLEALYRRVEITVGRTNYGMRAFNGVGLLSAPFVLPANAGILVLLANYTDYPAEDITLHLRGRWKKATLEMPGRTVETLTMYPVKENTAIEIPKLARMGAVRVE
jgi:hypothetical protein